MKDWRGIGIVPGDTVVWIDTDADGEPGFVAGVVEIVKANRIHVSTEEYTRVFGGGDTAPVVVVPRRD